MMRPSVGDKRSSKCRKLLSRKKVKDLDHIGENSCSNLGQEGQRLWCSSLIVLMESARQRCPMRRRTCIEYRHGHEVRSNLASFA
jgi:hypothetical protein